MRHRVLLALLALSLLLIPALASAAPVPPVGEREPERPLAPLAAPEPPWIAVMRSGSTNVQLSWDNVLEANYYEVHRDTTPYFDPALGQGNRIHDIISTGGTGLVTFVDDGVDRYAPDGTIATVQVVGNPAVNYYWVVRSRNNGGEVSDPSNRVGEFDFALIR